MVDQFTIDIPLSFNPREKRTACLMRIERNAFVDPSEGEGERKLLQNMQCDCNPCILYGPDEREIEKRLTIMRQKLAIDY